MGCKRSCVLKKRISITLHWRPQPSAPQSVSHGELKGTFPVVKVLQEKCPSISAGWSLGTDKSSKGKTASGVWGGKGKGGAGLVTFTSFKKNSVLRLHWTRKREKQKSLLLGLSVGSVRDSDLSPFWMKAFGTPCARHTKLLPVLSRALQQHPRLTCDS